MEQTIFLVFGLGLLYFGADCLVKGSSAIALRAGVPSLVVGLTIVAFGTSAPELVVSIKAGFDGLGDIAIGNVVGSNIFNIAVILGIAAIIRPIKVNVQVLRLDTPLMVAGSILLWVLLLDNHIGRIEGICLVLGIVLYTIATIHFGKKSTVDSVTKNSPMGGSENQKPLILYILLIMTGLAALIFGSRIFVRGAIELAHIFNISEAVIGLTIVSAGTSLPELATSIVATAKGEEDIAIGNIIGSNIFNILAVLGFSSVVTPLHSVGVGTVDLTLMIATAVILVPLMRSGFRIVRLEGILLLMMYIGYIYYLLQ